MSNGAFRRLFDGLHQPEFPNLEVLPAVAGVVNATQRIRVNGDEGYVEIL